MKEYPKTITYKDPDGIERSVIVISIYEEKLFKPPSTEREILDDMYANREINRIMHMDEKTKKKVENIDAYLLEQRTKNKESERKRVIKKYYNRKFEEKLKRKIQITKKLINRLIGGVLRIVTVILFAPLLLWMVVLLIIFFYILFELLLAYLLYLKYYS